MAEEEKPHKEPVITGENRDDKGKFLPGESGNPDGRPKGALSLTAMLRKALEEIVKSGKGEEKTRAQTLIDMIVEKALTGKDFSTIWNIINRLEGFPRQAIGIGLEEGVNITFKEVSIHGKGSPNDKGVSEKPPSVSTEKP